MNLPVKDKPEDVIDAYRAVADIMAGSGEDVPPSQLDAAILEAAHRRGRSSNGRLARYAAIAAGIACLCLGAYDSWRTPRPVEERRTVQDIALPLSTAAWPSSYTRPPRELQAVYVDELHTVSAALPDPATIVAGAGAAPEHPLATQSLTASEIAALKARTQDFSALVQQVGPAVVTVVASGRQTAPNGQLTQWSQEGAGFLVKRDGTILTTAHLLEGARRISVRLLDGRAYTAKLMGVDRPSDVAVISIPTQDLRALEAGDSRKLRVGDWVVAFGPAATGTSSATSGIVSAKAAVLPGSPNIAFIQTDAVLNPGSSGGPLIDLGGKVVAINSQIWTRPGERTSYAIPIELAMSVMDQIEGSGEVTGGTLAAQAQTTGPQKDELLGLSRPEGALAVAGGEQGPAASAALQPRNVIVNFSSQLAVDTARQCTAVVLQQLQGSTRKCIAQLTPRKDSPTSSQAGTGQAQRELGLVVRANARAEGLRVESANGVAAAAGIERGDVVLAVNGSPVSSEQELHEAVSRSTGPVAVLIQRGDTQLFFPMQAR